MDGYNFCKKILEHRNGGVKVLLELAGNQECEWLELKASVKLLPKDQEKGETPEDLYWSIANAVISMMNAYGGAVIIGISDDKKHRLVPLDEKYIKEQGMEKYLRCEIYQKVWKENWGNKYHIESLPKQLVEPRSYDYQEGKVAVLLVEPQVPCLRIEKGKEENGKTVKIVELRVRSRGDSAQTMTFYTQEDMDKYEKEQRHYVIIQGKQHASLPGLDDRYINKFIVRYADPHRKQRVKKIIFEWSILALLAIVSGVVWMFPVINSTLLKIMICLVCASFAYFVLPVFSVPTPIKPEPGMKTPDQIIVDHPLPTMEGHCLNTKIWWRISDCIDTYYGIWEMQRNIVFGNYRIVDPGNIVRCWGTQKMVLPVFEKLKAELEKECPPEKKPVPTETE